MKSKLTVLFGLLSILTFGQDLEVGNTSAGYNSYDASTGIVSGIYFDVLNNEETSVDDYRIAFFLVDPNDFDNNYEIHSINVSGQSGSSINEYTNIDINLYDATGIPDGEYRLLVCADEDDDISESDEANNCLYLSEQGSNLTFSPDNNTSNLNENQIITFKVFPTVVSEIIHIVTSNNTEVEIRDLSGKLIDSFELNKGVNSKNVSHLQKGVYLMSSRSNSKFSRKFIVL